MPASDEVTDVASHDRDKADIDQHRADPKPDESNARTRESKPERCEPAMCFCRAVKQPQAQPEKRDVQRDQDGIPDQESRSDGGKRRDDGRDPEAACRGERGAERTCELLYEIAQRVSQRSRKAASHP